jgi:hypothetical protein
MRVICVCRVLGAGSAAPPIMLWAEVPSCPERRRRPNPTTAAGRRQDNDHRGHQTDPDSAHFVLLMRPPKHQTIVGPTRPNKGSLSTSCWCPSFTSSHPSRRVRCAWWGMLVYHVVLFVSVLVTLTRYSQGTVLDLLGCSEREVLVTVRLLMHQGCPGRRASWAPGRRCC